MNMTVLNMLPNPKYEARSTKYETISNYQNSKEITCSIVLNIMKFENSDLFAAYALKTVRISIFGFRIYSNNSSNLILHGIFKNPIYGGV